MSKKATKAPVVQTFATVIEGLKNAYKEKLLPLEKAYHLDRLHQPMMDDAQFHCNATVLLVGQYSTGKTTFIRHLLESDFPSMKIGPEPTTDTFTVVMHGNEENIITGNLLVVDRTKPFRRLSELGNCFQEKLKCATLNHDLLKYISFVDTPGILSGEKQQIDRGYSMDKAIKWFSAHVDLIILLFDANKLDISDELKNAIKSMSDYRGKMRILLNKADMMNSQELMRVYGALMWSLGRVMGTPEPVRVYIGSFWSKPLKNVENKALFAQEAENLRHELNSLPGNSTGRKLNDLIKRAQAVKRLALILKLAQKHKPPSDDSKDSKTAEVIRKLSDVIKQVAITNRMPHQDLPEPNVILAMLKTKACTAGKTSTEIKFPTDAEHEKLIQQVDTLLQDDIPALMNQMPKENEQLSVPVSLGGALSPIEDNNPFGLENDGLEKGKNETGWIVDRYRKESDAKFVELVGEGGEMMGQVAKEHLSKSRLPQQQLAKIWRLADIDGNGMLDKDEFALAEYLVQLCLEGHDMPTSLPEHLVPPSKRA